MPVSTETASHIEANRTCYLQLKAAGQVPAKPLPPRTQRDGALLDRALVLHSETIPGGWYWPTRLARGQAMRLLNASGTHGVSVFVWNADDPSERYNAGDTVKVQWTAELRKGRLLLSDMGRVLCSLIEDTCGAHDSLSGGSTAKSNTEKYGKAGLRNTRDNLVLAAGKFGLGRRDVGPCVTFFAPVVTDAQGRFVWRDAAVQPGDFVDLRAEMNLLVAVSNCPHPLSPKADYAPGEIQAVVWSAPAPGPDDLCHTATVEARRAFENTNSLFA